MSTGVSARDLSDDDLRRELAQLKGKQEDIASHGTSHQQANHSTRTDELEAEFLRRFLPESDQPAEPVSDAPTEVPSDAPKDLPSDAPTDASADASTDVPSDAPTDDPDRPANPA